MSDKSYDDRAIRGVVAVTGASRGIGAAIALELATHGFAVAAMSRKGLGLEIDEVIPAEISDRVHGVVCDVNDPESIRAAFAQTARLGALSAVVCNAGIFSAARSSELEADDFDAMFQTNARGCFLSCREAFPFLKDSGGTVVNIGSFYDRLGVPGALAYCASKAAIGAITRCLAVEWARFGIRVVDVAPGFISTDLNKDLPQSAKDTIRARIPSGEFGMPQDVARLVRSIIADGIPFLTGETIYLDGAQGIRE